MAKDLTKEEAIAWLRRIMGPPRREILGKEKEQLMLLFQMMEPFEQTNNQHTWTDSYKIGNTTYDVTFIDDEVIVEEIEK